MPIRLFFATAALNLVIVRASFGHFDVASAKVKQKQPWGILHLGSAKQVLANGGHDAELWSAHAQVSWAWLLLLVAPSLAILALFFYLGSLSNDGRPQDASTHNKHIQPPMPQKATLDNNDVPTPMIPKANSFPAILCSRALTPGDAAKVALRVWSEKHGIESQMTYQEFAAAVCSGIGSFRKCGVSVGQRVAFMSKGTLDFFVGVVSVQALGATPVLLNWRQSVENLKGMIEDSDAQTLVLDTTMTVIPSLIKVFNGKLRLVAMPGKPPRCGNTLTCQWSWHVNDDCNVEELVAAKLDRSSEAAVFFSSGSTAWPKPIVHTHGSLLNFCERFKYPAGTTSTLSFLPNFHIIMAVHNFILPIVHGVCVSIHGADDTTAITSGMLLKAAEALRPKIIDTVPFLSEQWSILDADELEPLRRCAWVQSAGAPVGSSVAKRLLDAGVPFRQNYGQTETFSLMNTIPGAGPDELHVLLPTEEGVNVTLEGGGDEGELVIHGIQASPGVLKGGSLETNSKGGAGHYTGDVFRWVDTACGRGLVHVMRVDDVVLLSTGEMFNPLLMESQVTKFIQDIPNHGFRVTHVAVLGQNRPAPFLVIETMHDEQRSKEDVRKLLGHCVASANSSAVEYARIRPGNVLILFPGRGDVSLPVTAKGNFIRKRSEVALKETLDEMWNRRSEGNVREECEGLVAETVAETAVDSLGIPRKSSQSRDELEKICDNAKAFLIPTVIMAHWYQGKGSVVAKLLGEKFGLQVMYAMTALELRGDVSPTASWPAPSMFAFFFALGCTDGVCEGPSRVMTFFSQRTLAMFLILFFYKLFVCGAIVELFELSNSVLPNYPATHIIKLIWFVELMLVFRTVVRILQTIRAPPWLQLVIVFSRTLSYFWTMYTEDVYSESSIVTMILNPIWWIGLCSTPGTTSQPKKLVLGLCVHSSKDFPVWIGAYDWYACAHIISYYWGEDLIKSLATLSRRGVIFLSGDRGGTMAKPHWCVLASAVCFLSAILLQLGAQLASLCVVVPGAGGAWHCTIMAQPYGYVVGELTHGGLRSTGLSTIVEWWLQIICTALVFVAAIIFPWHAKRIGSNALGLYIFHLSLPLIFFQWSYVFMVWLAGFGGYVWIPIVSLCLTWPVVLCYIAGPTMNGIMLAMITPCRRRLSYWGA